MSNTANVLERPVNSFRAKLGAEAIGTFLLTFGLIGTAIFTASVAGGRGALDGVGLIGIALALGLTVMIAAFAFGPISGGHFNPAVTIGVAVAGRVGWNHVVPYILAQLVGAVAGVSIIVAIAAGAAHDLLADALAGGFASNGYGSLSPSGFDLGSVFLVEAIGTAIFVAVILRVTGSKSGTAAAPAVIGLTLTLLLLVALQIDNAGFNPARSLATAFYGGGEWLAQVWVFLVAPVVGAVVAGLLSRLFKETA